MAKMDRLVVNSKDVLFFSDVEFKSYLRDGKKSIGYR